MTFDLCLWVGMWVLETKVRSQERRKHDSQWGSCDKHIMTISEHWLGHWEVSSLWRTHAYHRSYVYDSFCNICMCMCVWYMHMYMCPHIYMDTYESMGICTYLYVCMWCVYMCSHTYEHTYESVSVCAHVHMHACRGLMLTLGVFLDCSSLYFSESRSLTEGLPIPPTSLPWGSLPGVYVLGIQNLVLLLATSALSTQPHPQPAYVS